MNEVYRLTLSHYFEDVENGGRVHLEEPIVVKMVVDRQQNIPAPVCLNRMMDMMREAVIEHEC